VIKCQWLFLWFLASFLGGYFEEFFGEIVDFGEVIFE
jgi:hypothetical protein